LLDLPSSLAHHGGVAPHFFSAQSCSPRSIFSENEKKSIKRNSTLGFRTFRPALLTMAASNPAFFGLILISEINLPRKRKKKHKKKFNTWFSNLPTSLAHHGGVEPHFYRLNPVLRGRYTQKAKKKA
jgi:hypothetical protein